MKGLTSTTAVLVLAAVPAFAAVTIQDLDVTGDNFVTFEEVRNAIPRMDMDHFRQMDTNNDQRLSADEINALDAQNALAQHQILSGKERVLTLLDANSDGFITFDEMQAVYPTLDKTTFQQIDKNNDQRLSYVEYYTPETQTAIAQCAKPTFLDLADMDQNGDKFLTMEELQVGYPGATSREFDIIDLNKDNRVSAVELLAPTAECLTGKN